MARSGFAYFFSYEGGGDLERSLLVGAAEDAVDGLVSRAEALEGKEASE
jgi:hypothetical protein